MKTLHILSCLFLFSLLLILVVPVTAESSTITKISPAVGYTGSTTTVTITGTNFNVTSVKVKLMMDGMTNITSTVTSHIATSIVCKFTIPASRETGDWDLVVINQDNSEVVDVGGFSIRVPMTLTSITPIYAQSNNASVDVILVGTGLTDVSGVYLYNEDYDNITAQDYKAVSAVKVKANFDLTDAYIDKYKICVKDSVGTSKCDLSFEITSDAVGSIDLSSSPSAASIYVDNSYLGTTPDIIENVLAGSHKVVLKKTGYIDWAKVVKVTSGETTTVKADLAVLTTEPTSVYTTVPKTTVPKTNEQTIKATTRSTVKVPTPWPSATAAPTSPVGILPVLGILCLAFIALRKH